MLRANEIAIIGEAKFPEPPTANVGGKKCKVEAVVKVDGNAVPLVSLNMMTDLQWHKMCLEERIEARNDPARWSMFQELDGGNTEAVIARLRKTIAEMEAAGIEWITEESRKVK